MEGSEDNGWSAHPRAEATTPVTHPASHPREDSEGVGSTFTPLSLIECPRIPTAGLFMPGGSQVPTRPKTNSGNTSATSNNANARGSSTCTGPFAYSDSDVLSPPPPHSSTFTRCIPYLGMPSGLHPRVSSPVAMSPLRTEASTLKEAFTTATEAGKNHEIETFCHGTLVSDDIKIEGLSEMQKMQGTSISAVAGQIGLLDKVVQARTDALSKEIEILKTASADQAQTAQELKAALEASIGKVAALQQEKDDMQKILTTKLHDLQSEQKVTVKNFSREVSELGFEITKVQSMPALNATFNRIRSSVEDITHRLDYVRTQEGGYAMALEVAIEQLAAQLQNTVREPLESANMIERKEFDEAKRSLNELKTAFNASLKRATQMELERNNKAEIVSESISDLTKRADEAIMVADSRSAALDAKVDDLAKKLDRVEKGMGSSITNAASDFIDLERDVKAKIKKMEETVAGLKEETSTIANKLKDKVDLCDFGESREDFCEGLNGLNKSVDDLEIRFSGELAEVRNETTCKNQDITDMSTRIDELVDRIDRDLSDVRKDTTCKEQTLKQMIDNLRKDLEAAKAEHEKKTADLATRTERRITSTRSETDSLTRLGEQLSALTTRVDGMTGRRPRDIPDRRRYVASPDLGDAPPRRSVPSPLAARSRRGMAPPRRGEGNAPGPAPRVRRGPRFDSYEALNDAQGNW